MCIFCLLLILTQNGRETEILGDSAFAHGAYEQALEHYYQAFDTPIVFVKRARVLSALRARGLVCDYDAYIDVILEFLSWAIEQDPAMVPLILEDTVLYEVANTVLFKTWEGANIENDSSIVVLLPGVNWFDHPEAITAIGGQMVFHEDGAVYVDWGTYYEYDEESGEFFAHSNNEQTGRFSVQDSEIRISWEDGTTSVYRIVLRGTCGVLIDTVDGREVFYDHPDECNT